jgi:hypothetical protein
VRATDILQRLYDSESNANGWKADGRAQTIEDATRQLATAAVVAYPTSAFAAWCGGA